MMITSQRSVSYRAMAVWLATTAVVAASSAVLLPARRPRPWPPVHLGTGQPFGVLLTQLCTLLLLGCAAWAWLITTVVTIEAVRASRGRPLAARRGGIPCGYRRAVLGICGLALGAGLSAPALAAPGPVHLVPRDAAGASQPADRAPFPALRARLRAPGDIVVRRGDSLWHLAAERLPEDASDVTIAHTWQRLYRANTAVIGADPDHIEPGQRLAQPAGW